MVTKDNIYYAAANLIAITSKDRLTGQWISAKERSYLRGIADYEQINDHNRNLDTLLVQHYPSIMDWERAVSDVLVSCSEEVKLKVYFYMETMADQDFEDGEDELSQEESKRIKRIVESCKIDEIAFRVKRKSIGMKCFSTN